MKSLYQSWINETEKNFNCNIIRQCVGKIIDCYKDSEKLFFAIPCKDVVINAFCIPTHGGCDILFDDGDNTVFYNSALNIFLQDASIFNEILATAKVSLETLGLLS